MTRMGKHFVNFSPAISAKAAQAIRIEIRSWKLSQRSDKVIEDLSRMFNPIVRGWLHYYGRYYRSALYSPMRQLDRDLTLWATQKYKKLRRHLRRASHWLARIRKAHPGTFRSLADECAAGLHDGSRMSREAHVRFYESLGV